MQKKYQKEQKKEELWCTYSVDSITGDVGIIMNTQFVRIVTMIIKENNECVKI